MEKVFVAFHVNGFSLQNVDQVVCIVSLHPLKCLSWYDLYNELQVTLMKQFQTSLESTYVFTEKLQSQCQDKSEYCRTWRKWGKCKLLPDFMADKCPLSCGLCDVSNALKFL